MPGLVPLALALLAAAPAHPEAPRRSSLAVAAASSLKVAAEELGRAFQAERPGVDVTLSFGASGALFAQVQNGAPFDLYLSADRDYPARLVAAGLAAAADERTYAFGTLVAWMPPGSRLDLDGRGLAALADASVRRVAIANPAVAPFGRATVAALEAAGVREAVTEKLVLGSSAAQAVQFASTGAAEVAFIPLSLTFVGEFPAGRIYAVPSSLYPRVEQSGVVLARAREPALARAFLAFLCGTKGRAILARYGYGLP